MLNLKSILGDLSSEKMNQVVSKSVRAAGGRRRRRGHGGGSVSHSTASYSSASTASHSTASASHSCGH